MKHAKRIKNVAFVNSQGPRYKLARSEDVALRQGWRHLMQSDHSSVERQTC